MPPPSRPGFVPLRPIGAADPSQILAAKPPAPSKRGRKADTGAGRQTTKRPATGERLQAGGGGFIGVVKSRDLSRGAGSSSGSGRSGRRHQLHPILPSVRRHACIASKQQDYDFGRLDNFWREQQLAILHSSSSPGPLDNCRNEYIYMQGEEHVHCDLFRDIGIMISCGYNLFKGEAASSSTFYQWGRQKTVATKIHARRRTRPLRSVQTHALHRSSEIMISTSLVKETKRRTEELEVQVPGQCVKRSKLDRDGSWRGDGGDELLLGKLTKLLGEEYKKLTGVRKQASFLKVELSAMKALLDRMELMDKLDPSAKNWRDHVREMSYDMENCIDDFMREIECTQSEAGFVRNMAVSEGWGDGMRLPTG
ncbi:hypothetical protein ZWY2020_025872 [Hordeum vulgare]|nr:hypothetical protein ZWY2020_025872 [Hordeum vulgare]